MIRLLVSLSLAAILSFTIFTLWQKRNAEFPFDSQSFRIKEPQFTEQERRQALLGFDLFRDTRFSANGKVACISCHKPEFSFADNQKFSQGIGLTKLNSQPIINLEYSQWFFWNGRSDSLSNQAMQPIEHPQEHGITKQEVASILYHHYNDKIRDAFQYHLPESLGRLNKKDFQVSQELNKVIDQVFVLFAKALAQYQRGLIAIDSPFDRFMSGYVPGEDPVFVENFGDQEWRGFQLFISKTHCVTCHSGANFTDQNFHFTGQAIDVQPGRPEGIAHLKNNPFHCLDQKQEECQKKLAALEGKPHQLKTPTLRNLKDTAPYFHDGSVATVRDILYLYNRPEYKEGMDDRIENLYLTIGEIDYLEAFLLSLSSPVRDLTAEYKAKHSL